MRYNEVNSEHLGELNIISNIQDDDSIFEVSLIVATDIQGNIRANYDLTVQGNIDADSLLVMGNFICFGNCKVNTLSVQGTCKVFGQLEVTDGMVADNLTATDIDANTLTVNGSIICNSLNFETTLSCSGKILALDGIMGRGKVDCSIVICGEYASIDEEANVITASELEESMNQIRKANSLSKPEEASTLELKNIEDLDWDECKQYLQDLSKLHPELTEDYLSYVKLFAWSEFSKICDLKQFIALMKDILCAGELTKASDLYNVIKVDLFEKSKEYVFELAMPSLNQEEFASLLNILVSNKEHISLDIYSFLIETMFNKIGLKYSTVCLMLEE